MLGMTLSTLLCAAAAPATYLAMVKSVTSPKSIQGELFGSLYQIIWQPTKLLALDGNGRTYFDP
jgi:hypothetical protein